MANSLKLSELTKVQNTNDADLFLISRDANELSSYSIQYSTITADLYQSIYEPLNNKIDALSMWLTSMLSGESSLNKISGDWGFQNPTKIVGALAVHDLAQAVKDWKPLWQ